MQNICAGARPVAYVEDETGSLELLKAEFGFLVLRRAKDGFDGQVKLTIQSFHSLTTLFDYLGPSKLVAALREKTLKYSYADWDYAF